MLTTTSMCILLTGIPYQHCSLARYAFVDLEEQEAVVRVLNDVKAGKNFTVCGGRKIFVLERQNDRSGGGSGGRGGGRGRGDSDGGRGRGDGRGRSDGRGGGRRGGRGGRGRGEGRGDGARSVEAQ